MRITYKYTNVEVPQETRDEFEKKLSKLPKWLDYKQSAAKLNIEVERTTQHHKKGDVFRAEGTLYIEKKVLRAEASNNNLIPAFDLMRHVLEREIGKFKREKENKENREERKFKRVKGMTALAWTGEGREEEQKEELDGEVAS